MRRGLGFLVLCAFLGLLFTVNVWWIIDLSVGKKGHDDSKEKLLQLENAALKNQVEQLKTNNAPPNTELVFGETIPVVLLCHNRPKYLQKTIDNVLRVKPAQGFPLFVSQDGDDEAVAKIIKSYEGKVVHIRHLDRSIPSDAVGWSKAYHYISGHFRFVLESIFDLMEFSAVILIEDDMDLAPDFFQYFSALLPVLSADPSLYCVSAWNDNGMKGRVMHHEELQRTNFFPGLGWMLTRSLWRELGPKWPAAYWDDWMREPDQRKGRDCIHPEVSRTRTFGKVGSSDGQFFSKYLSRIVLNDVKVDWSNHDFGYLQKEKWDESLRVNVSKAQLVTSVEQVDNLAPNKMYKIEYDSPAKFVSIAKSLGLMDDFKAGIPRGAYNGILSVCFNDKRLYIVAT